MVTLLLTFFVMIISITSLDPRTLAVTEGKDILDPDAEEVQITGPGLLMFSDPYLVKPLLELIANQEKIPPETKLDQDEIKSALFQLDPVNNPDYQRLEREVRDNISIFKDERGLVIRLNEAIVFPEGGTVLKPENLLLLNSLAALLSNLSLPVSVESHTNPFSELEGGQTTLAYRLCTRRSKIVMDYLTSIGVNQSRFRLGAYGGSRPVTDDPSLGSINSRLEIVIYKPVQNSWTG
jgi:flagellar motor protein MotB